MPEEMMEGEKDQNMKETSNSRIYEAAFHLISTLPEESMGEEMSTIKNAIEAEGGIFISEELPKLRNLAYTIGKVIDGHKHNFDKAYFGWVKFELSPGNISNVKTALDQNKNILRLLIVETVRENTMMYAKSYFKKEATEEEGGTVRTPEVAKEITAEDEELINKSIEELVNE